MIALLMVTGMVTAQKANAQVRVNINIGAQPGYGYGGGYGYAPGSPAGYAQAGFYYLPEINCYYDIGRSQYIYPNGGGWAYCNQLPPRYRGYDYNRGYRVAINRPAPYRYNRDHIVAYGGYRNNGYNPGMNREDNRNYGPGNGGYGPGNGNNGRGHGEGNGHGRGGRR